jgi:hypothetical protein
LQQPGIDWQTHCYNHAIYPIIKTYFFVFPIPSILFPILKGKENGEGYICIIILAPTKAASAALVFTD